jgi:hypothetical protein
MKKCDHHHPISTQCQHLPRPARGWKRIDWIPPLPRFSSGVNIYLAPQGDGNEGDIERSINRVLGQHLPRPARGWKRHSRESQQSR